MYHINLDRSAFNAVHIDTTLAPCLVVVVVGERGKECEKKILLGFFWITLLLDCERRLKEVEWVGLRLQRAIKNVLHFIKFFAVSSQQLHTEWPKWCGKTEISNVCYWITTRHGGVVSWTERIGDWCVKVWRVCAFNKIITCRWRRRRSSGPRVLLSYLMNPVKWLYSRWMCDVTQYKYIFGLLAGNNIIKSQQQPSRVDSWLLFNMSE